MCDKSPENQEPTHETKVHGFKTFIGEHKDSIDTIVKITGICVALITLILIKCQIDGISKQNNAIWYSNRPILRILPIKPATDLHLFSQNIVPLPDSTLRYVLNLTIENVGYTPASFDTVFYEAVDERGLYSNTDSQEGIILPPEDKIVKSVALYLSIPQSSIFRFNISYSWEKSNDIFDVFNYEKYYVAKYINDSWRIKLLSRKEYSSRKADYFGENKKN